LENFSLHRNEEISTIIVSERFRGFFWVSERKKIFSQKQGKIGGKRYASQEFLLVLSRENEEKFF